MSKQKPTVAELSSLGEPEEDTHLLAEERWQVVQRIILATGFQRAGQLRSILLYITRSAILHPDAPLREYEIACEVLGRRADFDPISDNIVRAQMSHLRRKLDAYYLEEGRFDTLRITIPKGSYCPTFNHADVLSQPMVSAPAGAEVESSSSGAHHAVEQPRAPRWGKLQILLAAACVLLGSVAAVQSWRLTQNNALPAPVKGNAFVAFLSRSTGSVSVVLPDTSLSLLQQNFQTDISAQDYGRNDYFQKQINAVSDPGFRELLSQIRKKRYTSIGEAMVASDFQRLLNLAGIPNSLRYARDSRPRDLNQDNTILIGSRKSNPWASLFNQRMNFVFLQDPVNHVDYFKNLKPQVGEQPRYIPYENQDGKLSSYIDVALTTNLTSSGYVLLFNGSDGQSVEAAAHFLLFGKLPPVIDQLLMRPDLNYFEIFLRGTHADAESEETFDVVAVRSATGK